MRRINTVPALWDAELPKQLQRDAIAKAKVARADRDWQSAEIQVERMISDQFENHRACVLSRCRRAHRCIGNPPLCWQPRIIEQVIPVMVQEWIERAYVVIQQEREAAAREGRAPSVLRPVEEEERRKR
jgi:hypothetical protein